jgi:4-hydroxy-tetrahydrodipicolinate synthase
VASRKIELLVPPLTPFRDDLSVDYAALGKQIDYIIDGCNATQIVAAGVEAQEYHYLDLSERKELVRQTVDLVGGRRPVTVGISHPSFKKAAELAQLAEKLGAASVQVLAPLRSFGGAPDERDLIAYYEAIARETSLPIILYLNAGPGADVSIPTTIALSKLDRVVMIKESSRDLARVSRLIVEIDHAGHCTYLTTVQMLLITLLLGGSGATMPAPAAELARGVIDAHLAGEHERAAGLQLDFALFPARWMNRGLTPCMKTALELIGIPSGGLYPPYETLDAREREALRNHLATTPLATRLV